MSNRTFIEKAIGLVQKAMEAERSSQWAEAVGLYAQGILALELALKYEKVESSKVVLTGKLGEYRKRREELQALLSSDLSNSAQINGSAQLSNSSASSAAPPQKRIESHLRSHVIGQRFAVATCSAAIRRWSEGWVDPTKPIVWLFLGPSGVGKTELCKALASGIFPAEEKEQAFIRLDMSEYQDKASVSKFLGAAPGYVGFSEGAPLVNALERRQGKGSIVLLDELEKADPDILTVLLQLFDEGRITSAKGRTINCTTAIFVCTSNVGSQEISKLAPLLRSGKESQSHSQSRSQSHSQSQSHSHSQNQVQSLPRAVQLEDPSLSPQWSADSLLDAEETLVRAVEPSLKAAFKRDEFLGRISEIIPFLPLLPAELELIVQQILSKWAGIARQKHGIELRWDSSLTAALAKEYNPSFGVRSLKNLIEKKVLNQLAAATSSGRLAPGHIGQLGLVTGTNGGLEVTVRQLGPVPTNPSSGPAPRNIPSVPTQ